ncbi:hypothetical protein GCM10007242_45260 [Pigmentiphaga litoralis]|uniref:LexA family protein n=1 Tax=Pigmentiphaga litoralis TaxID=516702 RepID=UPI001671E9A9|nr:S24 family peptidase [Pigmentiphaga litoralis]GGX33124.1 hypothetical protein GCM10007242_45260 [Pigmentiphaga litoralis]
MTFSANNDRDINYKTNVIQEPFLITFVKTFRERLIQAREARGMTQEQLARASGVSQGAIGNYESGSRNSSRQVVSLASALGVRAEWLDNGKGPMSEKSNVTVGPEIRGRLPLISWVRAGELCESPDNFVSGEAEDWFYCPVPHGPHSYCLRVAGDSMDDGTRNSYGDGDILFVDPSRDPIPNDDVIVRTSDGRATFKRLKRDEEGLYLLGLNGKRIIRVPEDTVFCGVVIFSGVRRG